MFCSSFRSTAASLRPIASAIASAPAKWRARSICFQAYQIDCRPSTGSTYTPSSPSRVFPLSYKLFQGFSSRPLLVRTCFTHTKMASGLATTDATKTPEEHRLPTDVKPTHYDVTIRTDLERLKFDGFVVAQYVLPLHLICEIGPHLR